MKIMQYNHHPPNQMKMKNKIAQDKSRNEILIYIAHFKRNY